MGSSKYTYYHERYKGSLTEQQCNNLDEIIAMNARGECIEDLRRLIYNISDDDVRMIIHDVETFGQEMHEYERPFGELRDYQTLGVAFAYNAGNFILGDSVGLGKTVVTAALCNLLKAEASKIPYNYYNYLFLTEKTLSQQVQLEMIKFTGEYVKRIPSGEQRDLKLFTSQYPYDAPLKTSIVGTHALFTTASFIAWHTQYVQTFGHSPFRLLIVDESSVLGGKPNTQVVTGFKTLAPYFERVIFLNATPFESNLGIFYNQLDLLDKKLLPSKAEFQKTYCEMRYNGMYSVPSGKYKKTEEFKKRIGYFYFARTRKDNGAELKNCKGGILFSPLSVRQKYLLSRTQMNRFVFDCPTYLDDTIEFNEVNVPKLGSLKKLLEGDFKDAQSILLFAYNKETQAYLQQWFSSQNIYSQVLNGDTPLNEREQIIADFKENNTRVLITNVQKGLNFGACNHVIFYGFDSNPSKMVQFEGRTTRAFNIENKEIYILCSEGLEETQLRTKVMTRAKATVDMTNVDISVVMDILSNTNEMAGDGDDE